MKLPPFRLASFLRGILVGTLIVLIYGLLTGCAQFELGSFAYCKKDVTCNFTQIQTTVPAPTPAPETKSKDI